MPTCPVSSRRGCATIRLLRELARPGRLVVIATHDDRLVPIADRVVELAQHVRDDDAGPPQTARLAAGEVLFEQGSWGQLVYVIEAGEIEILRERSDGPAQRLAVIGPGDYFGELGPLLGFPRSATARAHTDVELTAYGADDFKRTIRAEAGRVG